jgi:succinate dehydrogenase/fumarate reductase flavoprotein subunit
MSWCQEFIDAFNTHEVGPMQAITSPNVKWEDVSGHIEFEGLDGVKNMIELTLMAIPDCTFAYHGGMKNGNNYVVEWTMSGTIFGTEFACRGASVGETDSDGKILHNRDYWDSRSFPEMPAGPVNPELADLQAKHT